MHISHTKSYFSPKTYQTVKLMKLLSYIFAVLHFIYFYTSSVFAFKCTKKRLQSPVGAPPRTPLEERCLYSRLSRAFSVRHLGAYTVYTAPRLGNVEETADTAR
jgi:hypothetical protein